VNIGQTPGRKAKDLGLQKDTVKLKPWSSEDPEKEEKRL
jgi:hypothetical protein